MPTIAVDKAALFTALGKEWVNFSPTHYHVDHLTCEPLRYTTEEFDELCFDFGEYANILQT